jgi:hypothetical protein
VRNIIAAKYFINHFKGIIMTPHPEDGRTAKDTLAALEHQRRSHELHLAQQAAAALDQEQARAETFRDAREKTLLLQEIETARHLIGKICEASSSSHRQLEAENFRNYLEGTAIGLHQGSASEEVMAPLNTLIEFELQPAVDAEHQLYALADLDLRSRN